MHTKKTIFLPWVLTFAGMPLLVWALGDFPQRSLMKETLSLLTILAFCLLIGQFFWSRINRSAIRVFQMKRLIQLHTVIGYTCISILVAHPFLLVVPRFFEKGVAPVEAFLTIITTVTSTGVVLGIIAWCLMLILGGTALLRTMLPLSYRTWRAMHAVLASLFLAAAVWHVVDLGRHASLAMSALIVILAGSGLLLMVRTTVMKRFKKVGVP
jgi:predicted ferric reductase